MRVAQKPADPLVALIWEAMVRHDKAALENQRQRARFAVFAAALGPFAVLVLAIQALAFPHGGGLAVGLIVAELAAVAFVLSIPFLRMGRSHGLWIRERLRTEILRREQFLLRMRLGPYLKKAEVVEAGVRARLLLIDSDETEPTAFLSLHDRENGDWRSQLEDERRAGSMTAAPCLPDCLTEYLKERVEDQRSWFSKKSRSHGKKARRWDNGARIVLVLALAVAALHLGLLLGGQLEVAEPLHLGVVITAIVLPAIGAALVGLLSINGSNRLADAYADRARELEEVARQLIVLEDEQEMETRSPEEIAFEFKRLVLRAEEVLSDDLRQWWLIMKAEVPR